jgi:hypothetical protein
MPSLFGACGLATAIPAESRLIKRTDSFMFGFLLCQVVLNAERIVASLISAFVDIYQKPEIFGFL